MRKTKRLYGLLMFIMSLAVTCLSFSVLSFNDKTDAETKEVANAVAANGGAIYVGAGSTVTLGSDCTISGITGATNGGAIYVAGTLIIDGATIENCSATSLGGAIFIASTGSVTIKSGTISGCSANTGGAIYNEGGTLTITGGTISDCSATNYGGALALYAKGTTTISGGTISACSATNCGGAIDTDETTLTITGGTFSGNTAKYGSVINCYGSAISINGTSTSRIKFENNKATGTEAYQGGAINFYDEEYSPSCAGISYCDFSGNTATKNGADILFEFTGNFDYPISNCTFTNSTASGYGGSVYIYDDGYGSDITFTDCEFTNCRAQNGGGAIANDGQTNGVIINEDTSFDGCETSADGGAIYSYYGALTIHGGSFTSCQAENNGGAIFQDSGAFQITGNHNTTTFTSCVADTGGNDASGGAIYALDCGTFEIDDASFTNCSSARGGALGVHGDIQGGSISGVTIDNCDQYEQGAIDLSCTSISIDTTTISNCDTTDGDGGGIYTYGRVSLSGGVEISNCSASNYGGGVYIGGSGYFYLSSQTGDDQFIKNCIANSGGGGIYVGDSATLDCNQMAYLTISDCSTQGEGGGIYYADRTSTITMALYETTISDCSAGRDCVGGGVYVGKYVSLDCIYIDIYNCGSDTDAGGGMYLNQVASVNLSYSNIYSNTCGSSTVGANVHMESSSELTVGSSAKIYSPVTGYNIYSNDGYIYVKSGSTVGSANPSSNDRIFGDGQCPYLEYSGGTLYSILESPDNPQGPFYFTANPSNTITLAVDMFVDFSSADLIELSDFKCEESGYVPALSADGTYVYLEESSTSVNVDFRNGTEDRVSITLPNGTIKSIDAGGSLSLTFEAGEISYDVYYVNYNSYVEVTSDQGGVIEYLSTTSSSTITLSGSCTIESDDKIDFIQYFYSEEGSYSVDVQVLDSSGNVSTSTAWDISSTLNGSTYTDAHTYSSLSRVYDLTLTIGLYAMTADFNSLVGLTTYTYYYYEIYKDGVKIANGSNTTYSAVTCTETIRVFKDCVIGVKIVPQGTPLNPAAALPETKEWDINVEAEFEQDVLLTNVNYSPVSSINDEEKYVIKANRIKIA